jgi:general secretion pathway protein A
MYASFFGLKQEPFSIAPDPRYLYMSERHREALAHLLYGIRGGGGFVLLTGEIGAGKTTVCRCFLEQIPEHCRVAYIFNPKLTVLEMLKAVCDEFAIDVPSAGTPGVTVQDFVDPLNRFLLTSHAEGKINVLVIDEAQNLSADLLEQLRLLTNLETSERKLLQIILIGQPELRDMLARPDLEQLAQRVVARFHLEPLSEAETAQYILHRMRVGGLGTALPFDARELRRIHRLSRGVPRRINLLCDRALLGAYAHGNALVGRREVVKAASEVFDDAAYRQARASLLQLSRWRQIAVGAGLAGLAAFFGFLATAWQAGLIGWQPAAARSTASASATSPADLPRSPNPSTPPAPTGATRPLAAPTAPGAEPPASRLAAQDKPALATERFEAGAGWRNEQEALRALVPAWNLTPRDGEVCDDARRREVICYRTSGSLATIRQLDRPVLLVLGDSRTARSHVILVALDDQRATLQTADARVTVPVAALAPVWRGEFATFWRAPPGYVDAGGGSQSPAVAQWLSQQLGTLPGLGSQAASGSPEASLRARLQAFQVTQALQPDGLIGPVTMMKINRAIGVDEPRLERVR